MWRKSDVVNNVVISAMPIVVQRRWTATRRTVRRTVSMMICTNVRYVNCALIRSPIILPTRTARHWSALAGRTMVLVAHNEGNRRGLRPRETQKSRGGWLRVEIRGPGLRGRLTPPRERAEARLRANSAARATDCPAVSTAFRDGWNETRVARRPRPTYRTSCTYRPALVDDVVCPR